LFLVLINKELQDVLFDCLRTVLLLLLFYFKLVLKLLQDVCFALFILRFWLIFLNCVELKLATICALRVHQTLHEVVLKGVRRLNRSVLIKTGLLKNVFENFDALVVAQVVVRAILVRLRSFRCGFQILLTRRRRQLYLIVQTLNVLFVCLLYVFYVLLVHDYFLIGLLRRHIKRNFIRFGFFMFRSIVGQINFLVGPEVVLPGVLLEAVGEVEGELRVGGAVSRLHLVLRLDLLEDVLCKLI
jgi:hypothetical protein